MFSSSTYSPVANGVKIACGIPVFGDFLDGALSAWITSRVYLGSLSTSDLDLARKDVETMGMITIGRTIFVVAAVIICLAVAKITLPAIGLLVIVGAFSLFLTVKHPGNFRFFNASGGPNGG